MAAATPPPFTRLTAVAAPLDLPSFDADGGEQPGFVLSEPAYRRAQILVAAESFGGGSSTDRAVRALVRWGLRCVIAPGFGDGFVEDCAKNGLLAVILSAQTCAALRRQLHEGPGGTMTVDLEEQSVAAANGTLHRFTIDPPLKQALLTGRGALSLTPGPPS